MPAAPRMYLIVVYRPLPAAPLVVRCMYMVVVQRPVPAAEASRCCRRRFQQPAYACGTASQRGAQADARGATQVLSRGVQAAARGAARCLLHVLGRSAKTDACGRSTAVLPTQDLTAGLRLRHNRRACGIMLEVSRDASAAGEEQLASCTAEQSNYCLIRTLDS
jgi:hypothetical protein